jgi:hypothetical protein
MSTNFYSMLTLGEPEIGLIVEKGSTRKGISIHTDADGEVVACPASACDLLGLCPWV